MGTLALLQGDRGRARRLYEESRALAPEAGAARQAAGFLEFAAFCIAALAAATPPGGGAACAGALLAPNRAEAAPDATSGGADVVSAGSVAAVDDLAAAMERSATLFGAVGAWCEARDQDGSHIEVPAALADRAITTARAELGDERFGAAWEAGRRMSLDEALAALLGE
jgi:hypothetical protein